MSTLQFQVNMMKQNIYHCINICSHLFRRKLPQDTSLYPIISRNVVTRERCILVGISPYEKEVDEMITTQKLPITSGIKGRVLQGLCSYILWMSMHQYPCTSTNILAVLRKTVVNISHNICGISRWRKKLCALIDNSCFCLQIKHLEVNCKLSRKTTRANLYRKHLASGLQNASNS